MKKTNNKGFSLVELIVVVAIMAVLMVVVGPQLLRYVERSRIQRDNTAISEIANAMKIAAADETINGDIPTTPGAAYAASAGTFDFTATVVATLDAELAVTLGNEVRLTSTTYQNAAAQPTLTIVRDGTNVTVTGTNLLGQDGAALNGTGTVVY